jgi:plasmid maintenance system antidote protein VapI
MHLIQPRSLPTLSTPVNEPSSSTQTVNIAIVNPVNEPSLLVDSLDTTVNELSSVIDNPRQRVKALVDSGMSITQAASTVGVSRQTASKYVKEV